MRKNRRHEKLEISYEKSVAMAGDMYEESKGEIEREFLDETTRLKTRYEMAIETLNDETESSISNANEAYEQIMRTLEQDWRQECDRFKGELELLRVSGRSPR